MAMNSSGRDPAALRVHPAHQRLQPGRPGRRSGPWAGSAVPPRRASSARRRSPAGRAGRGCCRPGWPRRPRRRVRSRLASYIATSARRSRPSASRAWSGKTATPALASSTSVRPSRSSGEPRAETRARATRWALVVESATGSRTANSSPPSRAASAPRGSAVPQPAARSGAAAGRPARWPRVSLTERNRSRSIRTSAERGTGALGLVERGPGALQQPLPVGQSGERVAQLLLGAGAGDPQRGVEGDQRDGEQRQQQRLVDGDDDDQRGRCPAGRRRRGPAADQRGAQHGGQAPGARGRTRTTAGPRVTSR